MRKAMALTWDEIEAFPGFAGAAGQASRDVRPVLEQIRAQPDESRATKKLISRQMTLVFVTFGASFFALDLLLPRGVFFEVLRFVLFPVLFLACMAGGLFLIRGRLAALFLDARLRLGLKADAMQRLAGPLGLTFVPAPGGAPKGLKWLARQSWAPEMLRSATETLDAVGGMDDAVRIVRTSGVLIAGNTHVIGKPEDKARYQDQVADMAQLEDGFHGTRSGLQFDLLEWKETVDEAPDVYHLLIVLAAPLALQGVTQLRSRKTSWPVTTARQSVTEVDLGPRAFDALYRLRSTDQVEARAIFNPAVIERVIALAEGGPFRAVAQGGHLVFDFAGAQNRFQIVDLLTGEWSDETIRQTYADLAEALGLVDALAHAFMLAGKSDSAPG